MYLEFAQQNWYLFLALAAILGMIAFEPLRLRSSGARSVSAFELPRVVGHGAGVVIDVSSVVEFKSGHIAKAINIPLADLANSAQLKRLQKYKQAPVVVTCRNGTQSPKAIALLRKNEFTKLYTLSGGIAAWVKENFPLEKK